MKLDDHGFASYSIVKVFNKKVFKVSDLRRNLKLFIKLFYCKIYSMHKELRTNYCALNENLHMVNLKNIYIKTFKVDVFCFFYMINN